MLIVNFFLIMFIIATFKALRMGNDEIIAEIDNLSSGKLLGRIALVMGGLLFIQWQMFGLFGVAEFRGASLLLYFVIIYEAIVLAALLFFKETYLNFMEKLSESAPFVPKIPLAAELIILCYLLVSDILVLF